MFALHVARKDSPASVATRDPTAATSITNDSNRPRRGRSLVTKAEPNAKLNTDKTKSDRKLKDADEAESFLKMVKQTETTKEVLKEVVIPPASFMMPGRSGRSVLPSQSPLSTESELSSVRDQPSEWETPGTSEAVTPAESLIKSEIPTILSRTADNEAAVSQTSTAGSQNKRKRIIIDEDALLAQKLQEEEFQQNQPQKNTSKKRRRRFAIEESEDEDLGMSDAISEDFTTANNEFTENNPPPAKKGRNGGRLSLPTRAARDSARKSITREVVSEIMDTGSDDSELSEYYSEEESENLDSEAEEDDLLEAQTMLITDPTTAPSDPASIPTVASSSQRRRRQGIPQRARMARRVGLSSNRLSYRVRLLATLLLT